VTNVTSIVHGIVAGVPVPFPLPNPNACTDSGLTCPLTAGTSYAYHVALPIKDEYPSVSASDIQPGLVSITVARRHPVAVEG
jgi:Niemann-Pick C2 protein